ncbi:MAG: hypothetical protein CVU69_03825 [Deltaproteobacteria bacterium HGW-Deltaproteobacteria-4]|nr:MAG: hypothetical protein CVU69_03825 [Deltaproteobacteria bacterium HGW-Deltaproteobacteria-4]
MSTLSSIKAVIRRFTAGIIPGGSAVLRLCAAHFIMTRIGGRVAMQSRRSSFAAGLLSDRTASPSCSEVFAKRAELCRHLCMTFLLAFVLLAPSAHAAVTVDNTAYASYHVDTLPQTRESNLVSTVIRTPSQLDFLTYAPSVTDPEKLLLLPVATTSYFAAGSFIPMPPPLPLGASAPLTLGTLPLVLATVYHENEPFFLRLSDLDQNLDPAVAESVIVTLTIPGTSESEILRLTETGPDTGIFTGYIQSTTTGTSTSGNGLLFVQQNTRVQGRYTDVVDGTDSSAASALVDPYGIVFDSMTGLPVNGATITFINAATGLPATIYGDDGVSIYPSTITSGGTVTDSSGRIYTFPDGFYRFPFVEPGRYLLVVTPPAGSGYLAPSTVSTSEIQTLPGAPFAINPGSRGEVFLINPGPALHIDIPLDPQQTWLRLNKTASKTIVAIGDFLQYRIAAENTGTLAVNSVVLSDRLPLGLRYRKGSTKIDGVSAADPTLSTDGRSMLFTVGTLAAGQSMTITYVVEVAVAAPLGPAVNIATATGSGGITSNIAKFEIVVKEDLFSSKTTIVGRVYPNGCPNDGAEGDGLAGVRLYLENGTYVITDLQGMYHFEGIQAGTHVVQLDLETIPNEYELISCEENSRFAGTPFSQFVDLQGGTLWRADFYTKKKPEAPPVQGSVGLELASTLGDDVTYTVTLHVGAVPTTNMRLTVILPDGVIYQGASSSRDGLALADPEVTESVLTYRLGDSPADWTGKIRLKGTLVPHLKNGELTAKALLTFNTSEEKNKRTPLVDNILKNESTSERRSIPAIILRPYFDEFGYELSDPDKKVLDGIIAEFKNVHVSQISATGHTNSTRIAPRSRHIMADNYELSKARAKSVVDYLQAGLNLLPEQVTIAGKGPDEPIASNETAEGRALNRRVELKILTELVNQWTKLENIKEYSGLKTVDVTALKLAEVSAAEKVRKERKIARTMPEFDNTWLETAQPSLNFVWPYNGFYPAIPSAKIAVTHDPQKRLKLLLNGKEVDPLYLDGTKKRGDNQVAISLWIGIHLSDGDNLFEAVESSVDGQEVRRVARTLHYSTSPVKAEVMPGQSRLTADGKFPSVIAVRLTDKDGHPARAGLVGEYQLDPPYLPLQLEKDLKENPLLLAKSARLKYLVDEDGIARIELQPTTQTGEATLRFNFVKGESEVRAWLTPGEREWIIVGFAEGTAGYNSLSGNLENIKASQIDDEYYEDGRLAFFAKGMIQGKWLLTAAYDSAKAGMRQAGSLYGTIDPQQYYTLYGDASSQQYEAASARSLYLKIERDQFYALFGDYDTGLSVTELSRYSRNFNGLKSEMKSENLDFNLFVSDTNQAFVKDELRGDGTSGLYRLSRTDLVINSETITIESRDRFKSEVVISSQKLNRHIDYDIDYEKGTLFFKSPVYHRDENFNPIYIVINYESVDTGDKSYNYGGRGALRFMDKRVEVGATHVHEGRVGGEGNLSGLDTTIKLTEETIIKAEVATTENDFVGSSASGIAYLAEISHRTKVVDGKIYLREQDNDFGLGQQMGSESGTRKIGVDGTYRWNEKVSLQTGAFRQNNLGTDAVRDMAEVQTAFSEKGYSLRAGLRHAQDNLGNGENNTSDQFISGGTYSLFGDKLTLRAEHDQSLHNSNDNADFPTRTLIGADYRLSESVSFFIAHELSRGSLERTQMTRIGLRSSPWAGGQVSSSMEQQSSENGTRVFSVSGLKQSWQISKKWSVDAGLDRSDTIRKSGTAPFNVNVPAAAGTSDYTAITGGASYKEENWSWTGRLEMRTSDEEDKFGLFTGIYGEVQDGLGLGAAAQIFKTNGIAGAKETNGDLRFSLAYRPQETAWIVLNRLDYLFDKQQGGDFNYDNWRLINNINANWKSHNRKTQLSLQYGAKYVNETIDEHDYSGYTDLTGLEGRYDLTSKWDVGVTGKVLHSWQAKQLKYGSGASIGYNLVKNAWFSVGYNFIGFTDRDFSAADFTAQGPFVKFRFKFDQNSVREALQQF